MTLFQRALNFFYKPYCRICEKQVGDFLCTNCYLRLKRFEDFHIINFKEFSSKIYGFNYEGKTRELDGLIYLFGYKGYIRRLIIDFKFHGKFYLSKVFLKIILKNEKLCGIFKFYDIICSVPMHKNKLKKRGYNQAHLLAKDLAQNLGLYYDKNILIKTINNEKQSSLSKPERYENIKNVFKVQKTDKILNKKVILIDDICTTSATLEECSKVLKEAGANKVIALVIAKD